MSDQDHLKQNVTDRAGRVRAEQQRQNANHAAQVAEKEATWARIRQSDSETRAAWQASAKARKSQTGW